MIAWGECSASKKLGPPPPSPTKSKSFGRASSGWGGGSGGNNRNIRRVSLPLLNGGRESPTKTKHVPSPLNLTDLLPQKDPCKSLIGKTLVSIYRSANNHPTLFLTFSDGDKYQVMVAGYTPSLPSQTRLELDDYLEGLKETEVVVADCRTITMTDKASSPPSPTTPTTPTRWDQDHASLAFKFSGGDAGARWHVVSAVNTAADGSRTYEDVFLREVPPASPRKGSVRSRRDSKISERSWSSSTTTMDTWSSSNTTVGSETAPMDTS